MPQPVTRFTIRTAALIACIAGMLGLALPVWNSTRGIVGTQQSPPVSGWAILLLALTYAFVILIPLFYFALYRDDGTLRLSKGLRMLCLAAAIILGGIGAFGMWGLQAGPKSVFSDTPDRDIIDQLQAWLGALANLATILLLITLSRHTEDDATADVPSSRFSKVVTNTAAIMWGLSVLFHLMRLVATPYTYSAVQAYFRSAGRTPPSLADMMMEAALTLLSQACVFTAPFVVYRARLRSKIEPSPEIDLPEEATS